MGRTLQEVVQLDIYLQHCHIMVHNEILKYYHSTSRAHLTVVWRLMVLWPELQSGDVCVVCARQLHPPHRGWSLA